MKDVTGEEFTSKDFRTWGGVLAAKLLRDYEAVDSEAVGRMTESEAVVLGLLQRRMAKATGRTA